ncbi:M20 peptidase aminoacylase family protein [uncultured Planococcus sp.]|uniref:M20 peptidase aminoacylase family protein n=1 Tax=uncultured Planococcus sp. TaxID=337815 RepID=UPI002616F00F|nr:M20 peptidase aminoacylase family protein [uncultured Planococcus sp.]
MENTLMKKVKETFDYLHENAETSWEEVETTRYLQQVLEEHGCKTETFDDCTGVIGRYGNFDKGLPVVGIRADIDALWQEVNGEFQANHSCGHDAHMAMVLGVLWKLEQHPELADKIAVKFVFQPAEEKGEGALKLVEKGVMDDMDYFYGVHLRPIQETAVGYASPVIVHGAAKVVTGVIKGDDAHGARPHLNQNAIEIGAQIVNMINQIHLDPLLAHSVKMTAFHAGGKSANIIPGKATFSLDLRAQTNELMDKLAEKVQNIFESIQSLHTIEIDTTFGKGIAAAEKDQEAIQIMSDAIVTSLGKEKLNEPLVTPGGDDFHFYKINKPELKATMLGLGCGLTPGLHHPNMTFNHDSMMDGVNILHEAILKTYQLDT